MSRGGLSVVIVRVVVVRRVTDLTDIYHRQQRENERLHERDEYAEQRQYERHAELCEWRCEIRDLREHLLVREHVGKQTNAERERTDRITDQLDNKDERRDK